MLLLYIHSSLTIWHWMHPSWEKITSPTLSIPQFPAIIFVYGCGLLGFSQSLCCGCCSSPVRILVVILVKICGRQTHGKASDPLFLHTFFPCQLYAYICTLNFVYCRFYKGNSSYDSLWIFQMSLFSIQVKK